MPFVKGQSGNPGGRKKLTGAALDARELARKYTKEAIQGLYNIATDPKVEPGVRARCWDSLLDRGNGRPSQAVQVTGADDGPVILQWSSRSTTPQETKS